MLAEVSVPFLSASRWAARTSGDAVAERALGEGCMLAAGDAGEARDRPLVVDDREDYGRVVDRRKSQRCVEIAFRGRAFAGPAHADAAVALDRRAHRPADRLRKLRAEIARDRKEAGRLVGIHDREMTALGLLAPVRINLTHHFRQRITAGDEQPLLTIGRKGHVLAVERGGGGDRDRLLARALHVEAGLPLALRAVHAVVELA